MSLTIAHRLPGRLRVLSPELRGDFETLRRIEREVGALGGVRSATGNEVTGSVLIEYDPDTDEEGEVVARLQEASGLAVEPVEPAQDINVMDTPRLARAIKAPFGRLNSGLLSVTKGNMDLRFLLPVLLAGYGTLKLLRQGPVPAIPWYLLYWWSFRMFVLLNRQTEKQPS